MRMGGTCYHVLCEHIFPLRGQSSTVMFKESVSVHLSLCVCVCVLVYYVKLCPSSAPLHSATASLVRRLLSSGIPFFPVPAHVLMLD